MMNVNGLIIASILVLSNRKYAEAIKMLHQAWDEITDKSTQISEQISIQHLLGRCYFEQIKRSKSTSEAEIFVKQANENFFAVYEKISQLNDEVEKKEWEKIIRPSLRDIDYLNKDWNSYFEKKKLLSILVIDYQLLKMLIVSMLWIREKLLKVENMMNYTLKKSFITICINIKKNWKLI